MVSAPPFKMKETKVWIMPLAACAAGIFSFIADRLTKDLVLDGRLEPSHVFWFVDITLHRNYGLMGDTRLPSLLMAVLIALALWFLFLALQDAFRRQDLLSCLALGLVLGGAAGNLYDRIVLGYVFDWLMFFQLSIINLADATIAIGLSLYILIHLKYGRKPDVDCQDRTTDGLASG